MRLLLGALALCMGTGCASTITRLDGEYAVKPGPPLTQCEQSEWLVLAPTRYQVVPEGSTKSQPRDDGAGLYHVGSRSEVSITGLEDDLASPIIQRKKTETSDYDSSRIVAGILGGLSIGGMATGTALFIGGFDTKTIQVTDPDGTRHSESETDNDGTQIAIGAGTVGLGLVLGIIGLVVSPSHKDRVEAEAYRYAFKPGEDSPESVRGMVTTYNEQLRERCKGVPTDKPLPGRPAAPASAPGDSPWDSDGPAKDAPEDEPVDDSAE